jgi:hypothetical protein
MAGCALYINGKLLKCRCLKWDLIAHLDIWNTSYGQKKARESNSRESASFDSRPLKVRNRPEILGCRKRATYRWKGLDETYNFSSDGNSIGGLLRKLWGFKVAGVQSCAILGLPRGSPGSPGSPGTKRPFGCHPRDESQSILYGVRWWLTPKPGVWCVKVSSSSPMAVPTPKGPKMSSNHFVWCHEGPCEWISLLILPSPILELQHAPLPF